MEKQHKVPLYAWMLFLVLPFFSLIMALRNYKASWAKNILWGFIVFYGFNFVVSDEFMDANRYRDNFVALYHKEITFDNFFSSMLMDEESSYLDFASPVISFVLSRFTENPAFLFATFAFIFGFFYTRNVWFLLERVREKLTFCPLVIIALVALIIPFWTINGFRFWTATHIFIYGMLPYLFHKKERKYFLLASISIVFHFSYILPMLLVLSFSFITKNHKVLFYVFLASFLFSAINLQNLQTVLMQYAPVVFQKKVSTYVNQNYADSVATEREGSKWFVLLRSEFIKYFTLLLVIILYYSKLDKIRKNPAFSNAFAFILYFSLVFNLLAIIPSVGRFQQVSYFLLYGMVFLFMIEYSSQLLSLKRAIYLALPLILFYIVFQFRIGFQTINILTVIGNPLVSAVDDGESILDFIKK